MFDNYTLKARYYPVILLFLPIVITGLFYSFQLQTIIHVVTSLGLAGALTYLFSQLGRDQGKKKEPALFRTWGGMPTVQIMRLGNNRIDSLTKTRYHQKLQSLCPVPVAPTLQMEANFPSDADEVYRAWTRYLISQTRDKSKFSLLYKDNVSYGFRRNLWGLKQYSILLIIALLGGNYIYAALDSKLWFPRYWSESFIYSSIVLILMLLFWIFVITRNWVKLPAYSYAERLCESTELL